jgi:proteasome accessory factor B
VYEHQLYLLASNDAGHLHPYRFARISKVEPLQKRFEYPDKDAFEPERMFADSFGVFVDPKYPLERIEVSLGPMWDHYVKTHRWHPSQESRRENCRVHVSMKVRICPEVIGWILSFGAEAQVVSPPSLRQMIAERVAELARVYAPRQSAP